MWQHYIKKTDRHFDDDWPHSSITVLWKGPLFEMWVKYNIEGNFSLLKEKKQFEGKRPETNVKENFSVEWSSPKTVFFDEPNILMKYFTLEAKKIYTVKLSYNDSVVNEHSVITNRFLGKIGYISTQINPVITNKIGLSQAVRYNRVWLYLLSINLQNEYYKIRKVLLLIRSSVKL